MLNDGMNSLAVALSDIDPVVMRGEEEKRKKPLTISYSLFFSTLPLRRCMCVCESIGKHHKSSLILMLVLADKHANQTCTMRVRKLEGVVVGVGKGRDREGGKKKTIAPHCLLVVHRWDGRARNAAFER